MRAFLLRAMWVGAGALAIAAVLIFTGPRMEEQPNVRTYSRAMPLPPEGAVPRDGDEPAAPSRDEAAAVKLPEVTAESLSNAATAWGYYCAFCHGAAGDGRGPVGESFVPAPADLRARRIREMSDAEVVYAMFHGTGHEPVLGHVVPVEHRPWVLLQVRRLGDGSAKAGE
jgi:hypothetical protein